MVHHDCTNYQQNQSICLWDMIKRCQMLWKIAIITTFWHRAKILFDVHQPTIEPHHYKIWTKLVQGSWRYDWVRKDRRTYARTDNAHFNIPFQWNWWGIIPSSHSCDSAHDCRCAGDWKFHHTPQLTMPCDSKFRYTIHYDLQTILTRETNYWWRLMKICHNLVWFSTSG
jgi:hypothetical protein